MKTLLLLLFTLLLLADCGEKPRIKKKTPEQIKSGRKVSKGKEDNRRTVGVNKRKSSRRRRPGKSPEQLEAEAISALKSVTGLSTTTHNVACPEQLYPTAHTRFFENTLKVITFDYQVDGEDDRYGIFVSDDFFITRIDVGTENMALVHFKKAPLQAFSGSGYTWFLYFEDNGRRDARDRMMGHPRGDIQYQAYTV